MTIVVSLLLALAASVFVLWPLVRSSAREESAGGLAIEPLERRKLEAYNAIREAEFDFRTGKLSEADYNALVARYRAQAIAAIAAIAEAQWPPPHGAQGDSLRRMRFCPSCGEKLSGKSKFCGSCGSALRAA